MFNPTVLLVLDLGVAILFLARSAPLLQVVAQAKPNCTSHCGHRPIPYPFGTMDGGSNCYYDAGISRSFVVYCNNSVDPPVLYWNNQSSNLPIDDISVVTHEMRIMTLVARDCYSKSGKSIQSYLSWATLATFKLSNTKNRFITVGCDTYAYFTIRDQDDWVSTGCMSLCSSINYVANGTCLGVGCCEINSFPLNTGSFKISLGSYKNYSSVYNFNPCGFAFVAANNYYNFSTASLKNITEMRMPTVLDWSIGDKKCEVARENMTSYMCKENTNCIDADSGNGYRCNCTEGYKGNPYLSGPDGCQDINECETSNACHGVCTNLLGTYNCSCRPGYEGDPWKMEGCSPIHKDKRAATRDIILGVSIGFLLLLLCASWLVLGLKQRRVHEERKKLYSENGGLMLERLLALHQGYAETFKVFSVEDLKKATDNFDGSRILGEGGQGTVYKGTMMKNKTVAIKKAKMLDQNQAADFVNEVIVLHQINHKNVVKLIGCCLEMELPLLVYEFVNNGTLFEHLHGNCQGSGLSSWGARLRVAAETAGALWYLHSEVATPIVHRDVKSANILLDENYTAKVSDFGASRLMPLDQAQLTTLVQGTWGYLDPEYFHSGLLTEKSDVYSFGVVLAELLTGMKAISSDKPEKERHLSLVFVLAVKGDRCLEIIDKRILDDENAEQMKEVALLASKCLRIRGEDRPSMKEVALELEGHIRASERHPWAFDDSNNFREREHLLGEIHLTGTDSISMAGCDDTTQTRLAPLDIEDGR